MLNEQFILNRFTSDLSDHIPKLHTVGIFTFNKEFAINHLTTLATYYKENVLKFWKTNEKAILTFKDEYSTRIQWIRPRQINRGRKCDFAFIDLNGLTEDNLEVILYCCYLYCSRDNVIVFNSLEVKNG